MARMIGHNASSVKLVFMAEWWIPVLGPGDTDTRYRQSVVNAKPSPLNKRSRRASSAQFNCLPKLHPNRHS